MNKAQNPNLALLRLAVAQLGELKDDMVFVGGCATGLLISDPAARSVRVTRDVDVIVQVMNLADYYQLADRLRQHGFGEDTSDDAPLCRWRSDSVILDVMPCNTEILGFGNEWYAPAMEHAERIQLSAEHQIRRVAAPYFLITKLEAFRGRGNDDYMMSHDIEDIITVIDGRYELLDEIEQVQPELRKALATRFTAILENDRFTDAIPGHLLPDAASQARVPMIMRTIENITVMK